MIGAITYPHTHISSLPLVHAPHRVFIRLPQSLASLNSERLCLTPQRWKKWVKERQKQFFFDEKINGLSFSHFFDIFSSFFFTAWEKERGTRCTQRWNLANTKIAWMPTAAMICTGNLHQRIFFFADPWSAQVIRTKEIFMVLQRAGNGQEGGGNLSECQ
jgi:hypothetical protein